MNDPLPSNFAERVIELESLLDDHCSMQLITDLNQLYLIAIEYYINEEPHKARHFQKKITKLLSDPLTLDVIEKRSSPGQALHMVKKSKIKEQVSRFRGGEDEYVRRLLQKSQRTLQKNQALKKIDLNKQEECLQNRIMLKKYRSQEKLVKLQNIS